MDEYDQMKAQKDRMVFKDSPCAKCPRQAAMAEALRHADIDLSMLLPEIADRDMQKAVRKTLDMIDKARSPQATGLDHD